MFNVMPDDPKIEDMDPIMKAWMFYNWMEDYNDESKLLENQAYLVGSFSNPEAVKKMLGHGSEQHKSSDEEFDKISEQIAAIGEEEHLTRRQKRKRNLQKE